MKKILLTVAMLLSAAGMQAAAPMQQLAIKNISVPMDRQYNEANQPVGIIPGNLVLIIPIDKNLPQQTGVIKQGEPIPQGWKPYVAPSTHSTPIHLG